MYSVDLSLLHHTQLDLALGGVYNRSSISCKHIYHTHVWRDNLSDTMHITFHFCVYLHGSDRYSVGIGVLVLFINNIITGHPGSNQCKPPAQLPIDVVCYLNAYIELLNTISYVWAFSDCRYWAIYFWSLNGNFQSISTLDSVWV